MLNLKKYRIGDESLEEEEEGVFNQGNGMGNLANITQNSFISEITNSKQKEKENFNLKQDRKSSNSIIDNQRPLINLCPSQMDNNSSHLGLNMNSNLDISQEIPLGKPEDTSQIQKEKEENYHHVQIIDEDVENFKRRLDITLKNFRTDTLKDFMSIKRHLLVEQKTVIDSEKQKCDAQLLAKVDQIEHLKESLAKTKNALNKETEIKERLCSYLYKIKNQKHTTKLKQMAFTNGVLKYYKKKKNNKKVFNKIRGLLILRLKTAAFEGLKSNFKEMKTVKVISAKEQDFQDKLNEMSQYYGKEINDLRAKLQEANLTVEKFKESKNSIQENLKKALMRGVVAMNLEAMNVLEDDPNNAQNILENLSNNVASNMSPNVNQNVNILPKEDRKVVMKDNNWVNACAVPSKMKSNIISKEEIPDDFESEYGQGNNQNNYSSYSNTRPTPTPLPLNNRLEQNQNNYYEELTKSKELYIIFNIFLIFY